jgi:hypothetical protein
MNLSNQALRIELNWKTFPAGLHADNDAKILKICICYRKKISTLGYGHCQTLLPRHEILRMMQTVTVASVSASALWHNQLCRGQIFSLNNFALV